MSKRLLPLIPAALVLLCLSVAVTRVLGQNPEIVAKYGTAPIMDGIISSGEWVDASSVTFNQTTAYVMQDGVNLYVGFKISDGTENATDTCSIYFDVAHDGSGELQADDKRLIVKRDGNLTEFKTQYFGDPIFKYLWTTATVFGWTAEVSSSSTLWQVEYNITYPKISVAAGSNKTLGVGFESYDLAVITPYVWPYTSDILFSNIPALWGDMTPDGYNWVPEFSNPLILVIAFTVALPILLYVRARKRLYK